MSTAVLSRFLALPARPQAASWLERLAAWAERQPCHRRLGSWTVL